MIDTKNGKNGKYVVRVVYRDYNNKKREKRRTVATKSEAMRVERELKTTYCDLKKGSLQNNKITVAEYFKHWYTLRKVDNIRPNTLKKYQRTYNSLVKLEMNKQALSNLTSDNYQGMMNVYGSKHSKSSLETFNNHVSAAMKYAYQNGQILKNPSFDVILKAQKASKPASAKFIDTDDLESLLKVLLDYPSPNRDMAKFVLLTILFTGLRPGEALGLTWDNIDFEKQTISVTHDYDYITKHTDGLKNQSSNRTITVLPELLEKFKQLQSFQLTHSISKHNKENFVFLGFRDYVMTDSSLNKQFKRYQKQAKIKPAWVDSNGKTRYYTAHALRHVNASLMLRPDGQSHPNINQTLNASRRLGHSNVQTTTNIYSHIFEKDVVKQDQALNEQLSNLIKKSKE